MLLLNFSLVWFTFELSHPLVSGQRVLQLLTFFPSNDVPAELKTNDCRLEHLSCNQVRFFLASKFHFRFNAWAEDSADFIRIVYLKPSPVFAQACLRLPDPSPVTVNLFEWVWNGWVLVSLSQLNQAARVVEFDCLLYFGQSFGQQFDWYGISFCKINISLSWHIVVFVHRCQMLNGLVERNLLQGPLENLQLVAVHLGRLVEGARGLWHHDSSFFLVKFCYNPL